MKIGEIINYTDLKGTPKSGVIYSLEYFQDRLEIKIKESNDIVVLQGVNSHVLFNIEEGLKKIVLRGREDNTKVIHLEPNLELISKIIKVVKEELSSYYIIEK